MPNIDSQILSDRARAELAAKISQTGEGVNTDYVSLTTGVKPDDYVADTGLQIGSYVTSENLLQRVKWNAGTNQWDDFGEPTPTKTYIDTKNTLGTIDTISDLISIDVETVKDKDSVYVLGYYTAEDKDISQFVFQSGRSKSDHNGGTVINPDHNSTIGSANWYNPTGNGTSSSGTGCWVKNVSNEKINLSDFGCKFSSSSDDAPAFQSAHDWGSQIGVTKFVIPSGKIMNLNSEVFFDSDNRVLQYTIQSGGGRNTGIRVGSNLVGKFAINVNIDRDSGDKVINFPMTPRIKVQNLEVKGADAGYEAYFMKLNEAGYSTENLYFWRISVGFYTENFSDLGGGNGIRFISPVETTIEVNGNNITGSFAVIKAGAGDSWTVDKSLFAPTANSRIYIEKAGGVLINNTLGGFYTFKDCNGVIINSGYMDSTQLNNYQPVFTIINSEITFSSFSMWNIVRAEDRIVDGYSPRDHDNPMAIIDDDTTKRGSNVLFRKCNMYFNPTRYPGVWRSPDVVVKSLSLDAELQFEGNKKTLLRLSSYGWWVYSEIEELQTAIENYLDPIDGVSIKRINDGSAFKWGVQNLQPIKQKRNLQPPTVVEFNKDEEISTDSGFTDTTVYRAFSVVSDGYESEFVSAQHTFGSAENNFIKAIIDVPFYPCTLRIYKSGDNSYGNSKQYIDIPVVSSRVYLTIGTVVESGVDRRINSANHPYLGNKLPESSDVISPRTEIESGRLVSRASDGSEWYIDIDNTGSITTTSYS